MSSKNVLDRRRFVKLAGTGAAAAAVGLRSAPAARAGGAIALKVGVITPTGASYPRLGASLLDGLTLGLDEARTGGAPVGASVVARTVERGYAGARAVALDLLDGGCDVVVAGVSGLVARRLGTLFAERHTPLLVANVGAHVVPPSARNAFVLHDSLLYWQASYAFGQWAAASVGGRALLATAAADAGYDTVYAFRRGFETAGGTVVGEVVTHADPGAPGYDAVVAAVSSARPQLVYGLYSGAQAADFLAAYARSGAPARLALGALGVEDYALGSTGEAALGVLSCASWTASRSTRANESFTRTFRRRFGRAPDPFATLGYDAAAFLVEGVRRATSGGLGVRRLVEALAGVSLETPRGTLAVDAAANTVAGPLAIREVRRAGGELVNQELAAAPAVSAFPAALGALANGSVSGYVNEYLCA